MAWSRLQAIATREQRGYVSDHVALALVLAFVGYLVSSFAL